MNTHPIANAMIRTARVISCSVDLVQRSIKGSITFEVTFSDAEVRLDLGVVPRLIVRASAKTTSRFVGIERMASFAKDVTCSLNTLVRPGGKSTVVTTSDFVIDLVDALFTTTSWTDTWLTQEINLGLDVTRLELQSELVTSLIGGPSDVILASTLPLSNTTRSAAFGGTGGTAFETATASPESQLSEVLLYATTDRIVGIYLRWTKPEGISGSQRSQDLGNQVYNSSWQGTTLVPTKGEYITEVRGYADTGIRQLTLTTNQGRKIGPIGPAIGTPFTLTGLKVVGIFGRGGTAIDQLGFISLPETAPAVASPAPSAATAIVFNGVDTYIEVNAALPITAQATVEMWLRGRPQESHPFVVTDDSGGRRMLSTHVPYSDGTVYFDGGSDASGNYDRINKQLQPVDDQSTWNHWAFVRNSATGRMAIYRNGMLWHESASGLTRAMVGATRLVIGADGQGKWRHNGAISEVRLWNMERTAAQIQDNMNRVIAGADSGLIASYSLDGYQPGQAITDRSGGGRHGTVRGTAVSAPGPSSLLK